MSQNNVEVFPLFSIPVYQSNIDIDPELLSHIKRLSYKRLKIDNGYISDDTLVLENFLFKPLRNLIVDHLKNFIHNIVSVDSSIKWKMMNSWVVRHKKGDWSQSHNHPNCTLSGILYLQVDENSGRICFENINRKTLFEECLPLPLKEYNMLNSSKYYFSPKSGDIVIFPSHLSHSVEVCKSENERYCLPFNVYCEGYFGKESNEKISDLILEVKNGSSIF